MATEEACQPMPLEKDSDLEVQTILLAASQHDLEALRPLLWTGTASVQDPETGFTPLHAAIAACEPDSPSHEVFSNGTAHAPEQKGADPSDVESAVATVKFLLQNGAIWNDLDRKNETPACLARRLGLTEIYHLMVDAGVRAEMLLHRLSEYERLQGVSDDEEEGEEGEEEKKKKDEAPEPTPAPMRSRSGTPSASIHGEPDPAIEGPSRSSPPYSFPTSDAAIIATSSIDPDVPTARAYLSSSLTFRPDRLLDEAGNGVMMAWENQIMQHTAALLAPTPGLRVLNIGHGLGLIDTALQATAPRAHHIVEAHPDVLARLNAVGGWTDRAGVQVHAGRWQDVLPRLQAQGVVVDAVYFDTFAEDYAALRAFFDGDGGVAGLLAEGGRWGFFHGLGADRQVCYDVYTRIVEMDLREAGWEVEWRSMSVPDLEAAGEWAGVRRKYWALDEYRLPICTASG